MHRAGSGFGEAWWSLANLKTSASRTDLATMRRQLENAPLPLEHRFHLEFALGKALEDRRRTRRILRALRRAATHRRETAYYSPGQHARACALIKRTTRASSSRARRQRQRARTTRSSSSACRARARR
jgi:hypothetical protein